MDLDTAHLMDVLQSAHKEDLDQLPLATGQGLHPFVTYMDQLVARTGCTRQALFQKADLPRKSGYKLLSGERRTADRDQLLRLFIAMGLTLKETQRALSLYEMPVLYPKHRRDALLIIALNRRINSVDTVNQWLEEAGEAPLNRSGG